MNYILLFGMPGGGELFFIVLVIIMLFGSKKIPELARGLGKGMREIKNATGDIQREITEGAREINAAKSSVDIEKQVENLIKEDKEKLRKEESEAPEEAISNKELNQESTSKNEEKEPQTIHRRSPYTSSEPENPTQNS